MLGLSQTQVAERLSVKPTTLSNWENHNRAISIDIEQIDTALRADGVLAGLLWAVGTPKGLEARKIWTKVYPGEETPAWMWVRTPTDVVTMVGEWGVARIDQEFDIGKNGMFFTVPQSVNTSPIVIYLSEPSWVDFGRGQLPQEMPDAPVFSAINLAHRSSATGDFIELFFGNIADRFSKSRSMQLSKLNKSSPRSLQSFFDAFAKPTDGSLAPIPWPPLPLEVDANDRQRFAKLRDARGLSLVELSHRLAERTGVEASKDTLRRFESDVGEPHDRLLPAAIDHALGAEGHLAAVEIRSDVGSGSVTLPPYWEAPIWLELDGDKGDSRMQLEWGKWWRAIEGDLPQYLVSHYTERGVPLRVTVGDGVKWKIGVGRRAGAIPIDHGWMPINADVAKEVIGKTEDALLSALEHGNEPPDAPDETSS